MKKKEITIRINDRVSLKADLNVPDNATALIIFSHGSGSSRFSPRNRHVADLLNHQNMATLLADLLTEDEDRIYENRFDIELLTDRLIAVTNYALQLPEIRNLSIGYFGASTGAASALRAAAKTGDLVKAVVSRGGRPDLAIDLLSKVNASTLLIVGSFDTEVIILNKQAYSKLTCQKDLQIVQGASHLFEEPGKLDSVADLAINWFNTRLAQKPVSLL